MPWHRWTPAFPKPMPAKEDASLQQQKFRYQKKNKHKSTYSICLRASASSGFFAIFGRFTTVVWSAQEENISATGLLPWYAGRRIGLAGRGVRSVYLSSLVKCQLGDWIYSSLRTELLCNFPCYGTEHQGLRLFARLLDMIRYWARPMDGHTFQFCSVSILWWNKYHDTQDGFQRAIGDTSL